MIKQVRPNYAPAELEKRVQEQWRTTSAYEKTKELRAAGPDYFFVDGPPYTTGHIHLGTAWNKTLKDTVIRYKRMNGFHVTDTPGYDMHGLPIEVKVEQAIGVKNKKEIEAYGIDRFVSKCKSFALEFQAKMNVQFAELGIWMDWEKPYLTIAPHYLEAAWWTLKRANDRNLLVSAKRVLPCCPRCETALAEAEIEYWDEKDPSIFVKFPLKDEKGVSLLIWTTTPWTLLANLAVAAHPDFRYAKVRFRRTGEEDVVILMKEMIESVRVEAGWDEAEILQEMQGSELVGREYVSIFMDEVPYQANVRGKAHTVLSSDTVEASNTGLVHIAPGHGPEDFDLGKKNGIDPFCPIDETGRYTAEAGRFQGIHIKKANPLVIEDLKERNLMFFSTTLEHRYGHCWRCKTPVIFRTTAQWFLKITEVKDEMVKEVDRIRWTPEWAGSNRQRDWVLNARDWCISRQRYWGIPIPVWQCSCGTRKVIASRADLVGAKGYTEDMDLHRPWIDNVTFPCSCGGEMHRVLDVLDVWFDSAVASWAQLHYPTEKKEFERYWPAKFITEAQDQTRGWFYSQLAAGCIAFGRAPYDAVLMHGWMLDPKGQPMSKSLGNVIEPAKVITDYGADGLRFYLLKTSAPWEDIAFQWEGVKGARKTLNVLWNVVNFATTYMAIDKFDPSKRTIEELRPHLRPEDRWLISRTQKLVMDVTNGIESFEFHKSCRALDQYMLDDLSRWYVRMIRDRMWMEEGSMDKVCAYQTLHHCTMILIRLLAPICPHIAEEIYTHMGGELPTVHMSSWPEADMTLVDEKLERCMEVVKELTEIATRERQVKGVKLRWPLRRMILKVEDEDMRSQIGELNDILISQCNTKTVEVVPQGKNWEELVLTLEPNDNALFSTYRQMATKIAEVLRLRPAQHVMEHIEKDGSYEIWIEGEQVLVQRNMVTMISTLPAEVVEVKFSQGLVYLDFLLTEEIKAEAYARELTRRIQQMRKDSKLEVEDYITAQVSAPEVLAQYFKIGRGYIATETRSKELTFTDAPEGKYSVTWEIDGEKVSIAITPAGKK
ncbi:MAG: isoleucine--tRNA ligase [Methanomassiliicoccales archaeon]